MHTRHHRYYPRHGGVTYVPSFYYRSSRPVYVPGPTVYVERTYERPPEQIIQYVPIEEVPVVERTDSDVQVVETGSFLQEGDTLFRQGRYQEARRQYVRALLADENDPAVQLSYGFAHFALGEYGVAATAMRRALTADPGLMDAPPDPRAAYGDAADFEKQLAALRAYVAKAPQDMEAAFLLGYVAYATADTESALQELERVLAADDADTLAYVLRDAIVCAKSAPAEQAKRQRHPEPLDPPQDRNEQPTAPRKVQGSR